MCGRPREVWEQRFCSPNVCTKSYMLWVPAQSLYFAWVRPNCWSCGISQRGRRELGFPYKSEMLAVVIFKNWESFYHVIQSLASTILESSHYPISTKGLYPASWAGTSVTPNPLAHKPAIRDIDPLTSDQHHSCAPDTSPFSRLDRDTASSNKGLALRLQSLDPYNNGAETCHRPPVALQPPNKA